MGYRNRKTTRTMFIAIALALACLNPGAGSSSRAQSNDDRERQLLKRIIDVLNSTADDARKWDDKAVAARTEAQIADLIWDANPDAAQSHLKAAWSAATKVEEPTRERSPVVNPSARNSVRRDVLLVAKKRAPELAATWLDEIVEESKSAAKIDRGAFDDRSARSPVLLQMADQIVGENPKGVMVSLSTFKLSSYTYKRRTRHSPKSFFAPHSHGCERPA
jgi:hypothetical protein